ncbi:hypothetical protein AAG906_013141 [Vitis piasezkii]
MDFGKETRKPKTCWLQMDFQKTILSIVAKEDLELEQMDVKTVFLHGDLEETIYMKQTKGFVQGSENQEISKLKKSLRCEFDMKGMGATNKILGIEIIIDKGKRKLLLMLMWWVLLCMQWFALNIVYVVNVVNQFMANLRKAHWNTLKWTLRVKMGDVIIGFVDSNYSRSIDTRKSLSGYIFTFFRGSVSWKESLQKETMTMFCDNQSTIYLVRNPMFHECSKYIDVKLHFIRKVVSSGAVKVDKIAIEENLVDALTESLNVAKCELYLNLQFNQYNLFIQKFKQLRQKMLCLQRIIAKKWKIMETAL